MRLCSVVLRVIVQQCRACTVGQLVAERHTVVVEPQHQSHTVGNVTRILVGLVAAVQAFARQHVVVGSDMAHKAQVALRRFLHAEETERGDVQCRLSTVAELYAAAVLAGSEPLVGRHGVGTNGRQRSTAEQDCKELFHCFRIIQITRNFQITQNYRSKVRKKSGFVVCNCFICYVFCYRYIKTCLGLKKNDYFCT